MNNYDLINLKWVLGNEINFTYLNMINHSYNQGSVIAHLDKCLIYWLLREEGYDI